MKNLGVRNANLQMCLKSVNTFVALESGFRKVSYDRSAALNGKLSSPKYVPWVSEMSFGSRD